MIFISQPHHWQWLSGGVVATSFPGSLSDPAPKSERRERPWELSLLGAGSERDPGKEVGAVVDLHKKYLAFYRITN